MIAIRKQKEKDARREGGRQRRMDGGEGGRAEGKVREPRQPRKEAGHA